MYIERNMCIEKSNYILVLFVYFTYIYIYKYHVHFLHIYIYDPVLPIHLMAYICLQTPDSKKMQWPEEKHETRFLQIPNSHAKCCPKCRQSFLCVIQVNACEF